MFSLRAWYIESHVRAKPDLKSVRPRECDFRYTYTGIVWKSTIFIVISDLLVNIWCFRLLKHIFQTYHAILRISNLEFRRTSIYWRNIFQYTYAEFRYTCVEYFNILVQNFDILAQNISIYLYIIFQYTCAEFQYTCIE